MFVKEFQNLFSNFLKHVTMKIYIVFMLLFFTNCLAPTAILATVNFKTAVGHSVISPVKKPSFKEKSILKILKRRLGNPKKGGDYFVIGLFLIGVGIYLINAGNAKAAAAKPNPLGIGSFDGFGEYVLGAVILVIGLVVFLVDIFSKLIKRILAS
jgi:hypothetical protein